MDNHRTASARKPGCHCPARSIWSFLLMVVITPTASYSGSNVLQSRARPADAGPGPTLPVFTGVTERQRGVSAIKVTPPRAFSQATGRRTAFPLRTKNRQQAENDYLTGKAPYRLESFPTSGGSFVAGRFRGRT